MPTEKLKVLELFSGIGGMHWALKKSQKIVPFDFEIVRAVDICESANDVYKHNFPETNVKGSSKF